MARLLALNGRELTYVSQPNGTIGPNYRGNYHGDDYGIGLRSTYSTAYEFNAAAYPASTVVNVTDIYYLFRFRARKLPTSECLLITIQKQGNNPGIVLALQTNGTLQFQNGSTSEVIASAAISIGTDADDWTTIYGRLVTNGSVANQGIVTININGASIFNNTASPGTGMSSGIGMNATGEMQRIGFRMDQSNGANAGMELDWDQLILDTTPVSTPSRFTYVPIVANGNYQNWAGGVPDYRSRLSLYAAQTTLHNCTTTNTSSRQSYQLAKFSDFGITGNIKSVTIHAACAYNGFGADAGRLFIRRNAVDTDGSTWFYPQFSAVAFRRTIFDTTGFDPAEQIEIGILSAAAAQTYTLVQMGAIVEHDTPYVAPELEAVEIARLSYVGTGALQTIQLPFTPQICIILKRDASSTGAWWWESCLAFTTPNSRNLAQEVVIDRDKVYVYDATAAVNTNGGIYDVLCINDYQNRIFGIGDFLAVDSTSPYDTDNGQATSPLTDPVAAIINAQLSQAQAFRQIYYKGPASLTNQALQLFASLNPEDPSIREINAPGFIWRRQFAGLNPGHFPFILLKPGAFQTAKLVDIFSYTGDGTSSRVIPINLAGGVPVWVLLKPNNTNTGYQRTNQMSSCATLNGGATADGIQSFAIDSFTVNAAANANGVIYQGFAMAEGVDDVASNQYSGIYFLDRSMRHDTLWDQAVGAGSTTNVRIQNIFGRTTFVGDR